MSSPPAPAPHTAPAASAPPAEAGAGNSFSAQDLRAALGQFATGVTIITTLDAAGQPIGLTANSFNSVSLSPPLVLWSLSGGSASLPAFEAAGRFAVNVLTAEQRALAERFASKADDRFDGVAWRRGLGDVPIIEAAAAVFECRVHRRIPEGDHVIYIGQVEHCDRRLGASPLLFWGGRLIADAGL